LKQSANARIAVVMLITDGAVNGESDIIAYAEKEYQRARSSNGSLPMVRTHTFGIGPYCNKYFLKMLANSGHGYTNHCVNTNGLQAQMQEFVWKTNAPVLRDIEIDFQSFGSTTNQLYLQRQYPGTGSVPDLTIGSPVILGGFFTGIFPQAILVRGFDSFGTKRQIRVNVLLAENIPLRQVVARVQLDLLVGSWWLEPNDANKLKIQKDAIGVSIASSMPCVFTESIAHESAARISPGKPKPLPFQEPGKPTVHDWEQRTVLVVPPSKQVHKSSNTASYLLGGAALSGVILGVYFSQTSGFGNVMATTANSASFTAMESLATTGFDMTMSAFSQFGNAAASFDYSGTVSQVGNAITSVDYAGAVSNTVGAVQAEGNNVISTVSNAAGVDSNCCCCCCAISDMANCIFNPCNQLANCSQCGQCCSFGMDAINACFSCGDACGSFVECASTAVEVLGQVISIGPTICRCLLDTFGPLVG